jgi:hypothetical protein
MKKYFKFFFISIVIIILFFSISCTIKIDSKSNADESNSNTIKTSEIINNTGSSESTSASNSSESVPLPTPEDIVRLFFDLINEKRIPEAIDLMTDQMAGDDNSKQMWGIQFNAIQSIKVQSINPYLEDQWTASEKMFKVILEVSVSREAKDAPIPYYGWDSNPSTRWVSIKKDVNGLWGIDSLATGP